MVKKQESQRGSALMLVTIISLILAGISGAYITMSWWNFRRIAQEEASTQALYIAEAGAAEYISNMNANKLGIPPAQAQTSFAGGSYWIPIENIVNFGDSNVVGTKNLDNSYFSFQIAAKYNGVVRRADVLASHVPPGPSGAGWWAGNMVKKNGVWVQSDPNYTGQLGGNSGQFDMVQGSVYSGGNMNVGTGAQVLNNAGVAPGTVTYNGSNLSSDTTASYKQGTQNPLDIPRNSAGQVDAQVNAAKFGSSRDTSGGNPGTLWVDVGAQFNSSGITGDKWAPDGSVAKDLPASNPAHFIRQNPTSTDGRTNRTAKYEYSVDTTTVKTQAGVQRNDYYLEDPTNSQVTQPSLTGVPVNGDTTASMLNIGPESNNAVYFMNGNMRVSGENVKSYQLNPVNNAGPIKMTFIVQGNVSLTDNILYPNWESTTDVVAIVAVKDDTNWPNTVGSDFTGATNVVPGGHPNGPTIDSFVTAFNTRAAASGTNVHPLSLPADADRASQEYNKIYGSGNVFFGDPGSGTVEHFEAYMYAENNFYTTNLDASKANGGTNKVELYGNMTAGNHIFMDRSQSANSNITGYIPLRIVFDQAMTMGDKPPGVPTQTGTAGTDWTIQSWKLSSNTAELNNNAGK